MGQSEDLSEVLELALVLVQPSSRQKASGELALQELALVRS